ncbi:hypothetical protein [Nitrospira sp. Nam74]
MDIYGKRLPTGNKAAGDRLAECATGGTLVAKGGIGVGTILQTIVIAGPAIGIEPMICGSGSLAVS